MSDLEYLASKCVSVEITINVHRVYYQTLSDYIEEQNIELDYSVLDECLKRDVLVHVQAYSRTPISFWSEYHWDVNEAIRSVRKAVESEA